MPNHIVNEIHLRNVTESRARPIIQGAERVIDFSTLVPLPINFWPGSVGVQHERAFPGTYLDAATKTWGTKWNAYALNADSIRKDGDDVVLTFETAWAPPRGWVVALFNTLDCAITHFWQDEGSERVMVETYTPDNGESLMGPDWRSEEVPHGSADYRRLYQLQWGFDSPEEMEAHYAEDDA